MPLPPPLVDPASHQRPQPLPVPTPNQGNPPQRSADRTLEPPLDRAEAAWNQYPSQYPTQYQDQYQNEYQIEPAATTRYRDEVAPPTYYREVDLRPQAELPVRRVVYRSDSQVAIAAPRWQSEQPSDIRPSDNYREYPARQASVPATRRVQLAAEGPLYSDEIRPESQFDSELWDAPVAERVETNQGTQAYESARPVGPSSRRRYSEGSVIELYPAEAR